MSKFSLMLAAVSLAALSGCTTDDHQRNQGVSGYAGNAVAANTVLQMVDPWPAGVEDTDIETAADRLSEDAAPKQKKIAAPATTD
ncbi:MAG: hypothetical protein K8H74_18995 [Notoacmeibacter sp.]|nr:hypothetical protein [Notoacmeibacter sp.]